MTRSRREHAAPLMVPRGYKPPRDVRVSALTVDCPLCLSPAGEPCVNLLTGLPASKCHPNRRMIAVRRRNEGLA